MVRSVLPHLCEIPGVEEAVVTVHPRQPGGIPWSVSLRVVHTRGGPISGFHAWELAGRLARPSGLSWLLTSTAPWTLVQWFPSETPRRESWAFDTGVPRVRYPGQTR
jgi:hypothetical protein